MGDMKGDGVGPNTIQFHTGAEGDTPAILITKGGDFFVHGRKVENDREVYVAFKKWLKVATLLDVGEQEALWTSEPPKAPGWYWYRRVDIRDNKEFPVEVTVAEGLKHYEDGELICSLPMFQWYGAVRALSSGEWYPIRIASLQVAKAMTDGEG